MTEPNLEEMAIQYAILIHDVHEALEFGLFQKAVKIPRPIIDAEELRHTMNLRFGCYETQEAIRRAQDIVKMMMPATTALELS